MVRTRGLGRTLSRVIGKGLVREDEHHADDVSLCRRPTASARRRRVDVAIVEDVPQVTEDVLERTAGVDAVDTYVGSTMSRV